MGTCLPDRAKTSKRGSKWLNFQSKRKSSLSAEAWVGPDRRWCLRFGEVHPEVLERFGIQNPAVLLEGDLAVLADVAGE